MTLVSVETAYRAVTFVEAPIGARLRYLHHLLGHPWQRIARYMRRFSEALLEKHRGTVLEVVEKDAYAIYAYNIATSTCSANKRLCALLDRLQQKVTLRTTARFVAYMARRHIAEPLCLTPRVKNRQEENTVK